MEEKLEKSYLQICPMSIEASGIDGQGWFGFGLMMMDPAAAPRSLQTQSRDEIHAPLKTGEVTRNNRVLHLLLIYEFLKSYFFKNEPPIS